MTAGKTCGQPVEDIGFQVEIRAVADLGGVNASADAAVAVGAGWHGAVHYLLAIWTQRRCANGACAGIERLRTTIRAGGIGRLVTQQLLVILVAPLEAASDRDGARQPGDLPWIARIRIERRFLLYKLANVEIFGREGAERRIDGAAQRFGQRVPCGGPRDVVVHAKVGRPLVSRGAE